MNRPPSPLYVAFQFLTRLPFPPRGPADPHTVGRSLLHYPLVGAVIGLLLAATGWFLSATPPPIQASLVLALWVALTGALHLDGLADSVDAWVGGLGDRRRTLEILRDPRAGPMGVVALVVLLLVKYSALQAIAVRGEWWPVILIPMLARGAMLWLFLSTPYARREGLGAPIARHLPRRKALFVSMLVPLITLTIGGSRGLLMVVATALLLLLMRRTMQRRLGGTTGDTAGALLETVEATTLLVHALLPA
ncbi:MAG TPA: adenosylcobinamide-GDP ribazoletransferase [Thiotrichales bacterium]|nr:adenosylcobinamide-GDP ribazoletransferase [Thiotrichales bacterium]